MSPPLVPPPRLGLKPAPPLHFISADSPSSPRPCLPTVTAFPRTGNPTMLPPYFCPDCPLPHICPGVPLSLTNLCCKSPPPQPGLGAVSPMSTPSPLFSSLGSRLAPHPCLPVHLWSESLCPSPIPLFPPPGHIARHQTHPPASPGAGTMGGGGLRVVGSEVGGHSRSQLGPREVLRATASAERAKGLVPAGGGAPGPRDAACLPARLASCRPGPWVSSGAPCPQSWTRRPFSSRGQP